jgi:RNase P subunit RPR2
MKNKYKKDRCDKCDRLFIYLNKFYKMLRNRKGKGRFICMDCCDEGEEKDD